MKVGVALSYFSLEVQCLDPAVVFIIPHVHSPAGTRGQVVLSLHAKVSA